MQNLLSKLQLMLLHFLNLRFLCHQLPQTALQFMRILDLTPPFPNTLIMQGSSQQREAWTKLTKRD